MATPRGYSSYRGRTPKWKILTAVLLILVILLAVGYLVVQEHLVYDDSGIPHLDLPGWKDKKDTGGASSDDADASLPEITIEEPKEKTLAASELSSDPAQWAAEWSALKAEGCRAAVLPVKLPGGHVNVSLEAVNAAVPDAVAPDALGTEDLRQLLGEDGIYAVARISCFRDGIAGRKLVEQMGLKNTGGYIFYDGNNENWIDPGKEAARTYLTSLAAECASLGFREILLCDVGYPTVGKLSKIDYGKMEMNISRFPFLKAVQNVYDAAKLNAEQNHHHTMTLTCDGPIPDVNGDRERIEQVITNIVSNAVKYTPDGGRIDLQVGTSGPNVFVRVTDNGIGIPEKDLPRLFDRFYRVDKARSRESGGTGLGLSIAQEILNQHKGRIEISSEYGKGTSVLITMPAAEAQA